MVFCYQNCSDLCTVRKKCSSDREKLLKFSTLKAENMLEQFIQTVIGYSTAKSTVATNMNAYNFPKSINSASYQVFIDNNHELMFSPLWSIELKWIFKTLNFTGSFLVTQSFHSLYFGM